MSWSKREVWFSPTKSDDFVRGMTARPWETSPAAQLPLLMTDSRLATPALSAWSPPPDRDKSPRHRGRTGISDLALDECKSLSHTISLSHSLRLPRALVIKAPQTDWAGRRGRASHPGSRGEIGIPRRHSASSILALAWGTGGNGAPEP